MSVTLDTQMLSGQKPPQSAADALSASGVVQYSSYSGAFNEQKAWKGAML